jgi:hypothetical protein
MSDIIKDENGLYDLLGVPKTSVLGAKPGDTIIIKVDPHNTQEQMWAYGNMVKELLPDHKILVLPNNVDINYFPEDYASRLIGSATVRSR